MLFLFRKHISRKQQTEANNKRWQILYKTNIEICINHRKKGDNVVRDTALEKICYKLESEENRKLQLQRSRQRKYTEAVPWRCSVLRQ